MARSICNLIRDESGAITHRICSRCKMVIPIVNFSRDNKSKAGGYQRTCTPCYALIARKRRAEGRMKEPTYTERLNKLRRYRQEHPEKAKAHSLVASAIRKGALTRQPCHCGNPRSEAHHEDYSKPLDVIWLCRKHHGEHHRLKNEDAVPFIDWKFWGRRGPTKTYKANPDLINHPKYATTVETAELIRERYALGARQRDLMREFGLTRSCIHSIVHGTLYNPKQDIGTLDVSFNPEEFTNGTI